MDVTRCYRLVRAIGSGGMAQVFEGSVSSPGGIERRVAIKRVRPDQAGDAAMRRMFGDEARIASRLYHGNIVQVLDYGFVDGSEFLVMELVDGPDASRAAKQARAMGEPMPEGVALHVVAEVASALQHLHTRTGDDGGPLDIVHRDVSPANVLLSWEGDVKLSDFGIALAHEREERTSTGVVKGKLSYMAPEQALGRRATAAVDVYALGSSLHTLLVGEPPRSRDGDDVPLWASGREIVLDPSLTADVAAIVRRCVAIAPEHRPRADELASILGRLARARLETSGREALATWLAKLKPSLTRSSVLDELVNLVMVPVDGDRAFTVERASAARTPTPADPRTPEASDPRPASEPAEPPKRESIPTVVANVAHASRAHAPMGQPPRTRRGPLLALALATALAAVGLAASGGAGPVRSEPLRAVAPPPVQTPVAMPQPAPIVSVPPPPEPATSAVVSPIPTPPSEPPARAAHRPRDPAVVRASPEVTSADSAPTLAADGVTTGWLRVGGEAVLGGAVSVDGRVVGYAPLLREVSLGDHDVVVRSAAGETLLESRAHVAPEHTRAHALAIR